MKKDRFEAQEYEAARARLDEGLAVLAKRPGVPKRISEKAYADLLMELMRLVLIRNETINLTAITEPVEFTELHLLDSLACVGIKEIDTANNIVDVGCGAGFPGLPLAALYPEKKFLLTDSIRKKTEFVSFAANKLGIRNVDFLHARAEKAGREFVLRERFNLALCRAVGKLPVILEYTLPLVRLGGTGIYYKTVPAAEEIEESLLARKLLGGSSEVKVLEYADLLPRRRHALLLVNKEKPTPDSYPRREGIPSKVPL